MATLIVDNVGFDIEEMKKLNERDFINLHLSNQAIAAGRSEQDRKQYLKNAYGFINPKAVYDNKKEVNEVDNND